MKSKILILISFIFLTACSEDQARRIGYTLGTIVGSLNSNNELYYNGTYYYQAPSCYDHRFVDKSYNTLVIFDCMIKDELHYVAFQSGRITFAYILDL